MKIALLVAGSFLLLVSSAQAQDSYIVSPDGTYLGKLNNNRYDADSIANPYGKYGSKYSSDSINNPYGEYGSKYSNKSWNNPYASEQPFVVDPY